MDIQGILLGHVRMYVQMLILHVLKISAYALLSDLTKAYLCSVVTAVHTSGRTLSLADCSIPARRHIHTCVQSGGKDSRQRNCTDDDSLYMFVCYT